MVSLGMTPMDAIQSATVRASEMLEMKGEIGVVAAGCVRGYHCGFREIR